MARLWLVRHAPVAVRGVCYGQSNVPVTLAAADAARSIAEHWQTENAGAIPELWSSPWARTEPIAEQLAARWQAGFRADARLSELSFGAWEGREYADIERTDAARFEHWLRAYDSEAPPDGETVAQLRSRVAEWLDERRRAGTLVLAVTHAGVIRTARAIARGLSYRDVVSEVVPHLLPEAVA